MSLSGVIGTVAPQMGANRDRAPARPALRIREIVRHAATVFRRETRELLSDRRDIPMLYERQITQFVAHDHGHSLSALGRVFARDHTTIRNSVTRISDLLASGCPDTAEAVRQLRAACRGEVIDARPFMLDARASCGGWSRNEVAALLAMPELSAREAGERLGRTAESVNHKRRQLRHCHRVEGVVSPLIRRPQRPSSGPPRAAPSPQVLAMTRDLVQQGKSTSEIARILGVDSGTVRRRLHRMGVGLPGAKARAPSWDPGRIEKLEDLARQGHSARAIAAALEVSRNAVVGQLHRKGGLNRWPAEREERFRTLAASGQSASQIAVALGIGRGAVCAKAQRLGIRLIGEAPRQQPRQPPKQPRQRPRSEQTIAINIAKRRLRQDPGLPEPAVERVDTAVTLFDLRAGQCRWPVEGGFCGCDTSGVKINYCAVHQKMAKR